MTILPSPTPDAAERVTISPVPLPAAAHASFPACPTWCAGDHCRDDGAPGGRHHERLTADFPAVDAQIVSRLVRVRVRVDCNDELVGPAGGTSVSLLMDVIPLAGEVLMAGAQLTVDQVRELANGLVQAAAYAEVGSGGHPAWCDSAGPSVDCGVHLSARVDIPATAGRWQLENAAMFPLVEVSAAQRPDGLPAVCLHVVGFDGADVEVLLRLDEARRVAAAVSEAADFAPCPVWCAGDCRDGNPSGSSLLGDRYHERLTADLHAVHAEIPTQAASIQVEVDRSDEPGRRAGKTAIMLLLAAGDCLAARLTVDQARDLARGLDQAAAYVSRRPAGGAA